MQNADGHNPHGLSGDAHSQTTEVVVGAEVVV